MDEDIQSTESITGKRIRRKMLRSWSGEIAYIIEEEDTNDFSILPDKADILNKTKLLNTQKPLNKTNIGTDCARTEWSATKPTTIPSCGKFGQSDKPNSPNKHKCLKKLHSAGTNTEGPTNLHVCNHCKKYRNDNENYFKDKIQNIVLNPGHEKSKKIHTERGVSKTFCETSCTKASNRRAVSSKTCQYNEKPKIDDLNEDEYSFFDHTPPNTRKASVCANLGKPLNQFVGGTLDGPILLAKTNLRNDRKFGGTNNNNSKSALQKNKKTGRASTKPEHHTSFSGLKEDEEEVIKILPPLLQPPIMSYSKKCEESTGYDLYKESDKNVCPRPIALISERKSFTSSNELGEQSKFRNSLKNEFEIPQKNESKRYSTKSRHSILTTNTQSMNFATDLNTRKSQILDNKNVSNPGCFQPSIRTQAVDFTPFLTQLLESCLKIPYALNNIRNANNTFVSDLKNWKMNTQNIIDKRNLVTENNDNTDFNDNEAQKNDCTICKQCHKELETMLQVLNKKQPKSDNLTPCKCASNLFGTDNAILFSAPNQLPTYIAQCHIPYHHKMQSEMLAKIRQMQKTSNHCCRGCDISTVLSELELIRNRERKPRCTYIKEESSDEEESDCSHCSSCCSIVESNY